jgi:hypothetical protein
LAIDEEEIPDDIRNEVLINDIQMTEKKVDREKKSQKM